MASKHRLWSPWFICALLGLLRTMGLGCSKGFNNAPVKASKAREALHTALESWRKGDKVDALQKASPPIYVIDMEWQGGATLKDFEILGNGEEKDAHLFCQVKLTLRDPASGKEARKEATYIISTAPNLTVSRKVF